MSIFFLLIFLFVLFFISALFVFCFDLVSLLSFLNLFCFLCFLFISFHFFLFRFWLYRYPFLSMFNLCQTVYTDRKLIETSACGCAENVPYRYVFGMNRRKESKYPIIIPKWNHLTFTSESKSLFWKFTCTSQIFITLLKVISFSWIQFSLSKSNIL